MTANVRLILLLHNHQPIGNFHDVFQQSFVDSYLPFLDVFEQYDFPIALHTSGPLMEWLEEHQPEYVDRIAALAQKGRIEIVGGAYYEPILTMIPSRDRQGQISAYRDWLQERFATDVRGAWIAERVWEPSLTADLSRVGVGYTILDDCHFKSAGICQDNLHGYYLTEDDGLLLSVFSGSEQLRYLIPFADPQETIRYLHGLGQQHPGAVVVFGDDGEKFGTWPDTRQHVYDNGWLRSFFDALSENSHWLSVTTPRETLQNVAPLGTIYIPQGSYREMTEWALPVNQQVAYDEMRHEMEKDSRWPDIAPFVRGGFWRNFKVKYSEANEMYARMMMISGRLENIEKQWSSSEAVETARRELYRAQCNCSYWHGAFGGIYLPHLRNAVYQHLIAAENLLDQAMQKSVPRVEAMVRDLNLDGRQDVLLANDKLITLINPSAGGQIYEFDIRSICHNLLATLQRRPEAYHRKVLSGAGQAGDHTASIHDRVVFKQEGLENRIQYDRYARKSLLDHFYDVDASLESMVAGNVHERGDFINGTYEARIRRKPDRIQVQLVRDGNVGSIPIRITKGVTSTAGSSTLEVAYLLEGLPREQSFLFAVEFNFSGMPAGADDRFFYQKESERLGQLGTILDLNETNDLGLADEWLGLTVHLQADQPTRFWTFPVETVSQSERGFELIHQSVTVLPHWIVRGDQDGRWSATMQLVVDTSMAESRMEAVVATVG